MLLFQGVRELGRTVEGGDVVVTVDRFLRPVEVGTYRLRFATSPARS
jgi:hypothetical protein